MTTYDEMAQRAKPEAAAALAQILLRIYEADRTKNNGAVNGEAILCGAFRDEAERALTLAGVLAPAVHETEGIDAFEALDAIHGLLDGKEWNPDTLDAIADTLRRAGYEIREPA